MLLSYSSGINHKFVSLSRGPLNINLSFLKICMFCFLNTTVQFASHSTGTEISVLSNPLKPWPFCVAAGSSGDNYSCRVVTESIVVRSKST